MKKSIAACLLVWVFIFTTSGAVERYVDADRPDDTGAGTSWATAKKTIQAAIEPAVNGDTIRVRSGQYDRIDSLGKTITIQSTDGYETTLITGGGQVCASLNPSATLIGFSVSGGSYGTTGGTVSNCVIFQNTTGADNSRIVDSIIQSNQIGVTYAVVSNSVIQRNIRNGGHYARGAGVIESTLINCIIRENEITGDYSWGGGALDSTLTDCIIIGNRSMGDYGYGGGVDSSRLVNCLLIDNYAAYSGGGASGSTLINCIVQNNAAGFAHLKASSISGGLGGGLSGGSAYNCTIVGNHSSFSAGGVYDSRVYNSIVWSNSCFSKDANYDSLTRFQSSCTYPLPGTGTNNISGSPEFLDWQNGLFQLQQTSPCIDAGDNTHVQENTDFDGTARVKNGMVDMGAFEGGQQGFPVILRIEGTGEVEGRSAFVPAGGSISFSAKDGIRPFSGCYTTGILATTNTVFTWSGIQAAGVVTAVFKTYEFYVDAGLGGDDEDGRSWVTAKETIQAAIDLAEDNDVVFVAPGTYSPISTSNKAIRIQSSEGPRDTILDASKNSRCATLSENARDTNTWLSGFTLRNGYTSQTGGGARGGTLENCIMSGNYARQGGGMAGSVAIQCIMSNNTAQSGAGAYVGAVSQSLFVDNRASTWGGGLYKTVANHSTLVRNEAQTGGGSFDGILENCIVWENTAGGTSNYYGGAMTYTCMAPLAAGEGNRTADPQFVSFDESDFRLQKTSPCIDAGSPLLTGYPYDLSGDIRIQGAAPDMGAYEHEDTRTVLPGPVPYVWLKFHKLVENENYEQAALADADGDGMLNWQEYVAGTIPTNEGSTFKAHIAVDSDGRNISWTPVLPDDTNRIYTIKGKTNMVNSESWGETNQHTRFFLVTVTLDE